MPYESLSVVSVVPHRLSTKTTEKRSLIVKHKKAFSS